MLEQIINFIIVFLGGTTKKQNKAKHNAYLTWVAHTYRRQHTLTYYKAVSDGTLFDPRTPRRKLVEFIMALNCAPAKYLAIPVMPRC